MLTEVKKPIEYEKRTRHRAKQKPTKPIRSLSFPFQDDLISLPIVYRVPKKISRKKYERRKNETPHVSEEKCLTFSSISYQIYCNVITNL